MYTHTKLNLTHNIPTKLIYTWTQGSPCSRAHYFLNNSKSVPYFCKPRKVLKLVPYFCRTSVKFLSI